MIKAEELRIGNFVNYFSESADTWLDNHQVTANDILCLTDGTVDHADPIPITEEWLVEFGFEKGNWLYSSGYCIQILKTDFYLRPCYLGGFYWGFNMDRKKNDCELNDAQPIQYVHQLQNLFYALTQTELTPSDGGKIE